MKTKTSYALTEEAIELTKLLSKKLGIPQSNVLEIAIRKLAEQEKVSLHDKASQEKPN
jgi:hypothetical protein